MIEIVYKFKKQPSSILSDADNSIINHSSELENKPKCVYGLERFSKYSYDQILMVS